jgi:hypothetical protein
MMLRELDIALRLCKQDIFRISGKAELEALRWLN